IVDIDCDNLLDLFLGRVEGTVTRYEEVAGSRTLPDGPRFQFVTDRWEDIEIVAQLPGSMHGANTMYFADTDEDGDLDFYWGDFFEDGVLTIANQGSCAAPQFRSTPAPIVLGGEKLSTSGYNVPVLVDLDGDRDLDLLVGVLGGAYNPNRTAADNFYFLERRDNDYLLRSRRFLATIDIGSETRPAIGDLDGDGDADLLVGNKLDPADQSGSRLYLFRNLGSRTQPAFRLADTLDLVKSFHYAPALADLDGDRDLDLLLGTWNQGVLVYRNTGTSQGSQWQQDSTATMVLTRGSHATPAVGDVDGDGDLDLFVGEASGELNFFRNTGTARAFRFELVSDAFESIDVGQRSHPALHDYDGDGDLDLVVGQEQGGISFFRNSGTRTEPKFAADSTVKLALPGMSAPVFADVNGDGHAELIAGGISGGLWYFQRARPAK
ncbi:MAG TPA: FG-GAP-like repeat-containing protein, partial [Longimicrobiales bacterium]|nr:FG-GAP-like repeat-containing protein [Longimicrobiales bacterium]